jgi:mRNA-degrading endonuclease RelE of RelBE toxin-antitoxin system
MRQPEVPEVWRAKSFAREYRKLDPVSKEQVDDTLGRLLRNPESPGLNVESVRGASRGVKSCRVSHSMRMIYRVSPDGILQLFHVAGHDTAYRKAVMHWVSAFELTGFEPDREEFEMLDMPHGERPFVDESVYGSLVEMGLPSELTETILGVVHHSTEEGTQGKAKPVDRHGSVGGSSLNIIPSALPSPCHESLLVFCFDGDSFDDRLRETAYHAGIHCPNTRLVVFVTSKWDPTKWKKNHERAFEGLQARVVVLFAGPGRVVRVL